MEATSSSTNKTLCEINVDPLPLSLISCSPTPSSSSAPPPSHYGTSSIPLAVIFLNNTIINYLTLHEQRLLRQTCKYASQQILHYCPRIQRCHDITKLNKSSISYHVFRIWRKWSDFRLVRIMSVVPWAIFLFCILIVPLYPFFWIFSRNGYKGIMLEMLAVAVATVNEMVRVPVLAGELPKGAIHHCTEKNIEDINKYEGGPYTGKNLYFNILWLPFGIFYFIILLAISIYHFATIIGIPNGVAQFQLARFLLWPFGYSYYFIGNLDKENIPTKSPLSTSLRAFLVANNVEIVLDDGEPIPPTPQRWSFVARHTIYYLDINNTQEISKDQIW